MSPAEAVHAATAMGAAALDRDDVGVLAVGKRADLVLLDAPSYVHLAYRPGVPLVAGVWQGGRPVVADCDLKAPASATAAHDRRSSARRASRALGLRYPRPRSQCPEHAQRSGSAAIPGADVRTTRPDAHPSSATRDGERTAYDASGRAERHEQTPRWRSRTGSSPAATTRPAQGLVEALAGGEPGVEVEHHLDGRRRRRRR